MHQPPRRKLPRLVTLALLLLIGCTLGIAATLLLGQYLARHDVEALSTAIAQPWQIAEEYCLKSQESCDIELATGPFSRISISAQGDQAYEVEYVVREDALTVGDLMALWGAPEVETFPNPGNFLWIRWHDRRAFAMGTDLGEGLSPFIPLSDLAITFDPASRPD